MGTTTSRGGDACQLCYREATIPCQRLLTATWDLRNHFVQLLEDDPSSRDIARNPEIIIENFTSCLQKMYNLMDSMTFNEGHFFDPLNPNVIDDYMTTLQKCIGIFLSIQFSQRGSHLEKDEVECLVIVLNELKHVSDKFHQWLLRNSGHLTNATWNSFVVKLDEVMALIEILADRKWRIETPYEVSRMINEVTDDLSEETMTLIANLNKKRPQHRSFLSFVNVLKCHCASLEASLRDDTFTCTFTRYDRLKMSKYRKSILKFIANLKKFEKNQKNMSKQGIHCLVEWLNDLRGILTMRFSDKRVQVQLFKKCIKTGGLLVAAVDSAYVNYALSQARNPTVSWWEQRRRVK